MWQSSNNVPQNVIQKLHSSLQILPMGRDFAELKNGLCSSVFEGKCSDMRVIPGGW